MAYELCQFSPATRPSSHRGGAAAYRLREGLSTRSGTNTDEIQLRIDPMHSDLDDHISGLHSQVRMLRNVAQEIESEAKYQNDVITQLQMMLIKAQAGVKNNVRKLSKRVVKALVQCNVSSFHFTNLYHYEQLCKGQLSTALALCLLQQHPICVQNVTSCAVMEPVLHHEGHEQHPLTLLRRRAYFSCDACGIESADFASYTCLTCQYWIHSSCAATPHTIKLQIHEDDTHRFTRHCLIRRCEVNQRNWSYFCEKSGYFVHIQCAAGLLASGTNVIEIGIEDGKTYPNLMQFPRPSIDLLVADLITEHQSKNPIDTKKIEDGVDNEKESPVIHHWSLREHPLILLNESKNADDSSAAAADDDDDESDDNNHADEMLVCNGCVLPISTASGQQYYGCIRCNFFLHTFCADQLPFQSPLRKCVLHPENTLKLCKYTSSLDCNCN